jgi:hypothetical protein
LVFLARPPSETNIGSKLDKNHSYALGGARLSLDEIKKRINENKSLRFGSAVLCNTFLQTYCSKGVARRGESEFLCKIFAWSESGTWPA